MKKATKFFHALGVKENGDIFCVLCKKTKKHSPLYEDEINKKNPFADDCEYLQRQFERA